MAADPYGATASVYDLVSEGFLGDRLRALEAMIPLVEGRRGPVLDIGCGSGRVAEHLLATLPEVEVLALEPSDAMRSLALSRLGGTPRWRDRVTVRPEGALAAPLPGTLSGVIMLGVLGHLDRDGRGRIARRLAKRLPVGAPVLFDLQPPETPAEVPRAVFADTRVGRLRYRGIAEGSPAQDEAMRWRMTYETWDDQVLLETRTTTMVFHHPSPAVVAAELAAHGLTVSRLGATTFWLATRDAAIPHASA